jgi:stearoyl-CoA desaturase (delta-9 desaturase)
MVKYSKSLRTAFNEEVEHMKIAARDFADNHQWLCKDENKLSAIEMIKLEKLMLANEQIRIFIEMRRELAQIWLKTSASKEHLVEHLQAWCKKAELSGIQSLQNFSLKLRTYA